MPSERQLGEGAGVLAEDAATRAAELLHEVAQGLGGGITRAVLSWALPSATAVLEPVPVRASSAALRVVSRAAGEPRLVIVVDQRAVPALR